MRAALKGEAPAVPADAAGEEETAMDGDIRYMKTREAAALLGLSPRTLETYRWRGGGPAFSRFGTSVRYLRSHVLAWAAARRVRSTSDDGPRGRNDVVRRRERDRRSGWRGRGAGTGGIGRRYDALAVVSMPRVRR